MPLHIIFGTVASAQEDSSVDYQRNRCRIRIEMIGKPRRRPVGITALILFFLAGSLFSFVAGISLLVPSPLFDAMWRVNTRGHDGLIRLGLWAVALLFTASASCAAAAIGLWRKARWGHAIAITLISINLMSDLANAILGTEPRALVGVPIAFVLLLYLLSRAVRDYFRPTML